MPRGDGHGPQGLAPRTGRGKGRSAGLINSIFQKTTLGGTLFACVSMLVGNWLDKKLAQKKSEATPKHVESSKKKGLMP